ncbi:MAG: bifunctional phosphoribosylaminoimidazolecarboxamide formyltransferase/IMP cyclohydrolase, partial [Ignavibacteria bacterium]
MNKRALISVYDKTGIVEFTKEILKYHFEIISTSGTAKLLQENNIKIRTIEEITNFPEILNGRVKTLHPFIFAGILADKKKDEHLNQSKQLGFELFDLVVVNLYPFKETVKKENCNLEEAIEQIDIGGVSLIRAAAKNFKNVQVLVNPGQYQIYLNSLNNGKLDELSAKLASDAFKYVSDYDVEIAKYFDNLAGEKLKSNDSLNIHLTLSNELRYGENPHQKAKIYHNDYNSFYDIFEQIHGKELSYNNILDIDAAFNLINEFQEPACAVVKHTNPCGVAVDNNITQAYLKALSTDNVSAFGGIIIINREIDINTAEEIDKIFT